ncbi:MAG TPA: hypothetical protein DEP18_00585 [Flavobacteriales bacterium]|nr:hypothetical protein [Flavobacteriales bacterium]HRE74817.1 lipopolysaccharide biosynthesis protein [Flavobacteriales bacterium]HRJ35286.1 lipopolysaccharide biosynthesis protein [Flavobacteriales bacterium]HRJ38425.1 lipopolysaccharide biosynthesis protein [Flavobacteriales bacterium]
MKNTLQRYTDSPFIRNVFTLAAGSGLAQLISVGISPVLSRLFTTDDFAVYAVFFSWMLVIAIAAALRLDTAIPLPASESEAIGLSRLAIKIALLVTLICLIVVVVLLLIYSDDAEKSIPGFYILLPITMLTTVLMQVYNYLSTRWGSFRFNATSRVLTNIVIAGVSVVLGYLQWGPLGLILGLLIGQTAGVAFMYFSMRKRIRETDIPEQRERPILLLKKYSDFIWINTPHALLDTLQLAATIWILDFYFEDKVVGWFFLSWRILKMPLTFIGSAVFQVFYSKASKEFNAGKNIQHSIGKIYGQMFLLGLPICLVLLAFGPALFAFVFGEEWRGAGEMSRILSLWLFANFVVSPVSCIAMIAGKQKQAFLLAIIEHGSRLGLLAVGGWFGDLELALWLTTISGVIMMLVMMYWYRSIADGSKSRRVVMDEL